ncbi:hydrogenase expression/formation protein HypE [Nitrosophilus alvini]|uniref:hydrogenase expression/formation protein HypE n=1 Tax=Nitrosophilus alvini TaxID=2714855 RepID=UPI0019098DED|nr:hydrogenase expression/formation protein HypE [Nitrosophilus alvini]
MSRKTVTLAQGNGGEENAELINKIFYRHLKNETLKRNEDAAIIEPFNMQLTSKIAFTTDSFTVSPIFFSGGDIGKLSICGTCNDLAMMGAKPKFLSLSVIVEEGFEIRELEKIVRSMKKELDINGAKIVCGDTKVVPKGSADKIFVNTTGIGEVQKNGLSSSSIKAGDAIIVSRDIGRHGAAIFADREGIELSSSLKSDCASLWPIVEKLIEANIGISAMRDATRGGVAAVLNEWARQSEVCIEIEEASVPIAEEVKGICELLGFEAYNLANEGTFVLAVEEKDIQKALEIIQSFENGKNAAIIGSVTGEYPKKVVLKSEWGTKRFLDLPTGELLPRIC